MPPSIAARSRIPNTCPCARGRRGGTLGKSGVDHPHLKPAREVPQLDADLRTGRVPQGVAQRLLDDPVRRQLHAGRQWELLAVISVVTWRPAARVFSTRASRRSKRGLWSRGCTGACTEAVRVLGVLGAQHAEHAAQLGERLQGVLPDALQVLLQFVEGFSTRCGATWAWMEITDMWW